MARNTTWFTIGARDNATEKVVRGAKRQKSAYDDLGKKIHSVSSKMMGIGRGIGIGGMFSATAIGLKSWDAIETAARFETIATTIGFVSKSAAEAKRNMDFLGKTVDTYKVDYEVTAESFKRFLSSTEGSKFSWDKKREMFGQIAQSIRVLGLNAEATERIFYAFGESVSKGTFQAQEVTQQLGNSYPGFKKLLADAASGGDMKKLAKMMEGGKLDAATYLPKITQLMYERSLSGLDNSLKTSTARIQAFKTTWTMAMQDIGNALIDAGVIEMISDIVKGIGSWVKENKELIKQYAIKFVDGVRKAGQWIIDNWGAIKQGIIYIVEAMIAFKVISLAISAMALFSPTGVVIVGIGLIAITLMEAIREAKGLRDEFGELEKAGSSLATEMSGIGDVWGGFINLDLKQFLGGVWKLWYGIKKEILEILDALNIFGAVYSLITGKESGKLVKWSGVDDDIKRVDDWMNKDKIEENKRLSENKYLTTTRRQKGSELGLIQSKSINKQYTVESIERKYKDSEKSKAERMRKLFEMSTNVTIVDKTNNGIVPEKPQAKKLKFETYTYD